MHVTYIMALQKYVIDRILEDDGVTGDQYGPYDEETIKEERQRLKGEKVSRQHDCVCFGLHMPIALTQS